MQLTWLSKQSDLAIAFLKHCSKAACMALTCFEYHSHNRDISAHVVCALNVNKAHEHRCMMCQPSQALQP